MEQDLSPNEAALRRARGQHGQRRPAPESVAELMARAHALKGWTLGALAHALGAKAPDHLVSDAPTNARHSKGFVGRLIEDALGADAWAGERPDFPHLEVELKTIPMAWRLRPHPHWAAMASPFVCSIDMMKAPFELWETSRTKARLAQMLLIPIEDGRQTPFANRRILEPKLWRPSAHEWSELRADWESLMGAIGAGQAAALCARQGQFLQVRPKAAHSRVRTLAPAEDGLGPALPLGFYLRAVRLTQVLSLF